VQLKVRRPDTFSLRHEQEWPLDRTEWTPYHLDLDTGGLGPAPAGDQSLAFAARSEGAMFTTPPFAQETEFTGPAALKVFAASSTDDADLFVTVHLFDPSGAEVLFATASEPHGPVSQGWLRLSQRELDPARSLPYRPWHRHTAAAPLTPGQVYEADIEIWPLSIVVPAGYRLGISLRGQDFTHHLSGPPKIVYGREIRGSGASWHELPGDRDRPAFDGATTLHAGVVLLPLVPN
jgi:hypothetical protein